VLVDGFDNDEAYTGAVAATFSQDAVLEFQVLAAGAPAEFGSGSGGMVNTVTRSGSNEVRGAAYLFWRDDALNARERFEKYDVFGDAVQAPKAPFQQKQWGATLGGPLRKDRTFYFLAYEQVDRESGTFVTIDPGVAEILDAEGFAVDLGRASAAAQTNSALLKLEHSSSPGRRLQLRAHYSRSRSDSVESFGGTGARSHGVAQAREDWGIALARTDVFASGWLSEARLQVVRGDQSFQGLDPRCGGPCEEADQGGPEITIAGLAVAGRQLNTPQVRKNLDAQLAETLTLARGRHTMKAGLDAKVTWRDELLAQDFGGRYVFTALPAIPGLVPRPLTALEAFAAGLPALYFQGYGDPTADGVSRTFSLFAQDHWRITPRLSVVAGLRYQHYDLGLPAVRVSAPGGSTLEYEVPARGNLGPRASVSFDPTGRGRTLLRAAFGEFHEDPLLAVALVTDIVNGQGLRLLQSGLPLSAEAWRSPDHRLPEPATPFPSLVQVAGPGFRVPSARHLSAGVTHELGRDLRLTVDLLAVEGRDQIGVVDYNPLLPSLGPGRRPNDVEGRPGTSASVNQFTNYGESSYRGLAVSLRGRMGSRFEALASYTLSEVEDTGSDMFGQANTAEDPGRGRDPADPAGLPLEFAPEAFRGPAATDQRHRFVLSALAELPWRLSLSGIVAVGAGRPYTALVGVDANGDGVAANDRARRDPRDPATRVDRNDERMEGTAAVDARLARRFALPRGASLDVLVEAFNLLDRVNYSDVNNVFGTGAFPDEPLRGPTGRITYGRYTRAHPPRQVQFALRLAF
jgi:hypothetical protein